MAVLVDASRTTTHTHSAASTNTATVDLGRARMTTPLWQSTAFPVRSAARRGQSQQQRCRSDSRTLLVAGSTGHCQR